MGYNHLKIPGFLDKFLVADRNGDLVIDASERAISPEKPEEIKKTAVSLADVAYAFWQAKQISRAENLRINSIFRAHPLFNIDDPELSDIFFYINYYLDSFSVEDKSIAPEILKIINRIETRYDRISVARAFLRTLESLPEDTDLGHIHIAKLKRPNLPPSQIPNGDAMLRGVMFFHRAISGALAEINKRSATSLAEQMIASLDIMDVLVEEKKLEFDFGDSIIDALDPCLRRDNTLTQPLCEDDVGETGDTDSTDKEARKETFRKDIAHLEATLRRSLLRFEFQRAILSAVRDDANPENPGNHVTIYEPKAVAFLIEAWTAAGLGDAQILGRFSSLKRLKAELNHREMRYLSIADKKYNKDFFYQVCVRDMGESLDTLRTFFGVQTNDLWPTLEDLLGTTKLHVNAIEFPKFLMTAYSWGWDINDVMRFSKLLTEKNIDIGETTTMFANSEDDQMLAIYRYTPESLIAKMEAARAISNITRFGHISLLTLNEISSPVSPERPIVKVTLGLGDWNGANYVYARHIDKFIAQGYQIDLREVGTRDELLRHFDEQIYRAPAYQIFIAHSFYRGLFLGIDEKDPEQKLRIEDNKEIFHRIRPKLIGTKRILAFGCELAADPPNKLNNFASILVATAGVPVEANQFIGTVWKVMFSPDGDVEKVVYIGLPGDEKVKLAKAYDYTAYFGDTGVIIGEPESPPVTSNAVSQSDL